MIVGSNAMIKHIPLACALLALLLGPIFLRPRTEHAAKAGEQELVIITPHNEAIRGEFARAFAAWYQAKTGERVHVDWRTPGGTSEIARYVASEYLSSFKRYWQESPNRAWSTTVEQNFDNPKITLNPAPAKDTPEQQARRAFLDSNVGCGIDLFFGGGSFDFSQQAAAGRLVDCGVVAAHPELFNNHVIPKELGGEPYWDAQGRWIGVCLASFGICSNTDSLARLGIPEIPKRWADLANPLLFHEVALANPTQSGSVNRAFELLIQQQILETVEARKATSGAATLTPEDEADAIRSGWARAMRLLMKIGANARYFTDSSSKVSLDVAAGEAAAGMTIDFYGRVESEAVRRPDGTSRLQFVNAQRGTTFSADPIGLLRGAPNPKLAKEFIEWSISPEGQKLWNWKVGTPGGPTRYALRRLPILPALYAPEFRQFRSDPDVNPYATAGEFTYHSAWTAPLFRPIAFIVRIMCIDPHEELTDAWHALIEANYPPQAMEVFSNVDAVSYDEAKGRIRNVFGPIRISEVQLAKELADHFRAQYRHAAELARAGK